MPHHTHAGRFSALNKLKSEASQAPRPSKRVQAQRAARDPSVRLALVRRAYFVAGAAHPLWDVGLDAIIDRISTGCAWSERVDLWISDVALSCACIRGDQSAWSELITCHMRSLCEGAELRLSPQQSRLLVERFIRELRASTLAATQRGDGAVPLPSAGDPSLHDYRGGQTLARWLLAHILARVETMPLGAPMSLPDVRREERVDRSVTRQRAPALCLESEAVASILDSTLSPRTLAADAPASARVPLAT